MVSHSSTRRGPWPPTPSEGKWVRLAAIVSICFAIAIVGTGLSASWTAGGVETASCNPGWRKVSEHDNSFAWKDSGLLAIDSVSWTGAVQLLEEYDSSCYVLGVVVEYTGPLSGGTLTLTGSAFVSFTIQYPTPFRAYGGAGQNAYGDLVSWNPPAGRYLTHAVRTNFGINGRGADEFVVEGLGATGLVPNVRASFSLPLGLVGKTVSAQVHAGPEKYSKVTHIPIPGATAPPPPPPPPSDTTPPATATDLRIGSVATDSATLLWTAPGDDGMTGQATWYDIRYSGSGPITSSNFAAATHVSSPFPRPPGSAEQFTVTGLSSGTTYWFALRASDEVPNWSEVSNTVSGTTAAAPPPADTTPPATVSDLHVASAGADRLLLGWTAPGNDGITGQAAAYDIRYSTSGPLTDSNFDAGTVVASPTPRPAGTAESLEVAGLASDTRYWFGLRTADEVPNWSPVSNSPDAVTAEAPPPPPKETWSVYVHAHDDDWQLFQSPSAVFDYRAGHNLVFVYATAGDAGGSSSYWLAREEAAMASVRWFVGSAPEDSRSTTICYTEPSTVCRNVQQRTYGTTVSFFMRLPDGNVNGGGFESTNFESLSKLRDGEISSISAIDGSTTYGSWQDLYLTLEAIIRAVAPYDSSTVINAPDFDRNRQSFEGMNCDGCSDHADHLAVADAVHTIAIGRGAPWSRVWFIDYPLGYADSRYPANLDSAEYQIKRDVFMAYNERLKELTGFDTYALSPVFYDNCLQRNYYRVA